MNNNLTVFSQDLIPVYTTDEGKKVVLGRELHEKLGIITPYHKWFPRMVEYGKDEGFEEGETYWTFLSNRSDGKKGKPKQNHILSLRMAKHIASIQKTNVGYNIREKLFVLEEAVNEKKQGFELDAQRLSNPSGRLDLIIELATQLKAEEEKTEMLRLECSVKDEKIAVLEPKANYYDLILQSSEALTVSQIAEDYGFSPQAFNKILNQFRIQHKVNGQWILYQEYKGKGYIVPRTYQYSHSNGSQGSSTLTCWTQKGRVFLYNFLKEKGIIPTIERG